MAKDQSQQPPRPGQAGQPPGGYEQNPNGPNDNLTPGYGLQGQSLGAGSLNNAQQTAPTGPVYYTDINGNRQLDENATRANNPDFANVGGLNGGISGLSSQTGTNGQTTYRTPNGPGIGTPGTPGQTGTPGNTEWGQTSNSVTGGQINTTGPTAGALVGLGAQGPIQGQLGGSGPIQGQVGGAGGIQGQLGPSGAIQNRVDMSGLGDYQTAANYGAIQGSINRSNVPGLVGGDALAGAMTDAQKASYQNAQGYLDPQWNQDQQNMETKLANQGVMQNSEAWNKAMGDFQRNKEFAYSQARTRAVGEGNAANQQLFGQGLAVNQNAFGQELSSGQFANSAQAQGAQQSQFNANLANQARQAQGNELMQSMALNNAAQNQGFNQQLASGQFANASQAQNYGQLSNNMTQANAAQNQGFSQGLAGAQFANQSQNQNFAQNLAGAQLANQNQNQLFTQGLAGQAANNAAQQQGFGQNLANSQLQNSLQEQLARQGLTREQIAAQLQGTQAMANAQTSSSAASSNASMTNAANALAAQQNQNRFLNDMTMRNQGLYEQQLAQQNPWDMYGRATNGVTMPGNPSFTTTPNTNSAGAPDMNGINRNSYDQNLNLSNSNTAQRNGQQQAAIDAIIAGMGAYGRMGG